MGRSLDSTRSLPDRRVYRGALLGLGGIARSGHLPAFQADPTVASRLQIVGIVDETPSAPSSFQGIPLFSSPAQLADLGGQIQTVRPDQNLDRGAQGMQVVPEAGDQALLLGRGPQREVDRRGHRDQGQTVTA